MGRRAQWQTAADLGQRGKVQAVRSQVALGGRLACSTRVLQAQVPAGPHQAIVGLKLQPLGVELEAACQPPATHPPLNGRQHQGLELRAQRGVDFRQCQVGRAAHDLATLHVGPCAHGAPALRHLHTQVGMVAQPGDIHTREIGKQLAAPVLPVAVACTQQWRTKPPGQREPVAPSRRRCGRKVHVVLPAAITQQHINIFQRQFGGTAQFVGPAQPATLDDDFALGEKPVCCCIVLARGLRKGEARHRNAAVGLSADIQIGVFDVKLLKTPVQQRARGRCHHHARQQQRNPPLAIQQRDIQKLNGGDQPLRPRRDGPDAHRQPQRPCGLRLQLRAKFTNTRHNPAMQCPPRDGQQQPQGQQASQRPSRQPGDEAQQACGAI